MKRLTILKQAGIDKQGNSVWRGCFCNGINNNNENKVEGCTVPKYTRKAKAVKNIPKEYGVYRSMLSRCYNPKHKDFVYYGGRGIGVCERWRGDNGFKIFYADMGKRPTPKHTIDRINNNEGYSKENCRWTTRIVQNLNRRTGSNNTSGRTGVVYSKAQRKFQARIAINGVRINLGFFKNFEDAVKEREIAETKYHKPILYQAGLVY